MVVNPGVVPQGNHSILAGRLVRRTDQEARQRTRKQRGQEALSQV